MGAKVPDWLAITLAVASPILSVIATAYFMGRRVAVIETTQAQHSKALEALPDVLRGFVTQQEGKGFQAQLDRLERNDAECEGRMAGVRQENADRIERLSSRVTAHEQSNVALTTGFAKLETTMSGMKEAIDRLAEAERAAAPKPNTDIIAMLSLAAQAAPLVRQLLEPARHHA